MLRAMPEISNQEKIDYARVQAGGQARLLSTEMVVNP